MTGGLPAIRVVAAVIVRDGWVLVCRRNSDRSEGGLWEFPGGKIEPGERPVDALAREIHEELGVEIHVDARIHRSTTDMGTRCIDLDTYLTRIAGDPPVRSTDHDTLRWLRTDELSSIEWCSPDQPVVKLIACGEVPLPAGTTSVSRSDAPDP